MKNILVILPFAFYRSSGSSLSSYYRVRALLELGHNVDALTYPHGEELDINNLRIFRAPRQEFFKTLQPGEYKKKIIYDFFLFLKYMKLAFTNKYDVIIAHSSMIYWTILLKPFLRSLFLSNMHGNLETEFPKWGITTNNCLIKFAGRIDSLFNRYYDKIICEHEGVGKRLFSGGITEGDLILIPICVTSKRLLKPKQGDKNCKFIVLYTGSFVKIQNLGLIYRTAERLKNQTVKFWIVGGIEREIKDEYKLIKSKGVGDIVKLFPRKSQQELVEFYEKADIVISPRTFGHDTPMKIFNYMNYGKCILATNKPIHTEILNNENAYLAEETPEAFTEAILYLKHHSGVVEDLGQKAKDYFEKNFSFEIMKENYKELFQEYNSID